MLIDKLTWLMTFFGSNIFLKLKTVGIIIVSLVWDRCEFLKSLLADIFPSFSVNIVDRRNEEAGGNLTFFSSNIVSRFSEIYSPLGRVVPDIVWVNILLFRLGKHMHYILLPNYLRPVGTQIQFEEISKLQVAQKLNLYADPRQMGNGAI